MTESRRHAIVNQPIGPTLFRFTLPMLLALVAIMGLGVIDSFFVSMLGTQELAAMGFIIPIAFTMSSVSLGLGMAISTLTSKLIGANKNSLAARLITDGFYLTLFVSIVLSALLALNLETVFILIGAEPQTIPVILAYMKTWVIGCAFMMLTQVCSSTFRAIGDTKMSATISVALTLINLCLDPLLIFGIGPFPELGIQGAALATVLAVCCSTIMAFYYLGVKERLILLALPELTTFKKNIKDLVNIAIPAMLANAIIPITATIMTSLVAKHGTQAVAGYGVGIRIESFSLIFAFALSATLPMFVGQNLGANQKARVAEALKISFKYIFLLQVFIYLCLALSSKPIAKLFSQEDEVITVIQLFIWIIPVSYCFSAIITLINVTMNVLGKPKIALYINIIRLCLISFPLAYLGSHFFQLKGLFIGISLGNLIAFILAAYLLKTTLDQLEIPLTTSNSKKKTHVD